MRSAAVVLLLALVGCTGAHRYGTPRTLPPGEVAHQVSLDLGKHVYSRGSDDGFFVREKEAIIPFPSYGLRVGLADRLEFGATLGADTTLQVNLKTQLVHSRSFDLAVAPTVGAANSLPMRYDTGDDPALYAVLPLLVGIRVGGVTLVPGGGIGYLRTFTETARPVIEGPVFAGSLSAFIPLSDSLQIGPGVTVLKLPVDHADPQLLGGVTLVLGSRP